MSLLSWPSIGCYCLFSIFVFYQQLHAKNFRGASEAFGLILSISAFLGMLTGFAYLGYYGWSVVWWGPIVIFILGILSLIVGFALERALGALTLSLAGFIVWPISAYFMFQYIPK
jgi:hypothetical protein